MEITTISLFRSYCRLLREQPAEINVVLGAMRRHGSSVSIFGCTGVYANNWVCRFRVGEDKFSAMGTTIAMAIIGCLELLLAECNKLKVATGAEEQSPDKG